MQTRQFDVITVTVNPAIDRTLVIPNFTAGHVNRVQQTREVAGGKGVNVASALADFGIPVAVTGFLGRDNAAIFETLFQRKEIADHFIRIDGSTRVGLKIVDPAQQQTTDINFPGLTPSVPQVQELLNSLQPLMTGKTGWLVMAGSVPPGVDPTIYAKLISQAKAQGWKTLVDTSNEPLRHAVEAGPTIIKPNIHELETWANRKLTGRSEILEAARQALSHGITLAAISMGEAGALFVAETEAISVKPPAIEVAGTVGAGDAMVAGIIAAHLRGLPLVDSARLAIAFALVLLAKGQHNAILSPSAVEEWKEKITIQP